MINKERLMDYIEANRILNFVIECAMDFFFGADWRFREEFTQREYEKCDALAFEIEGLFQDRKFIDILCETLETDTRPQDTISDYILMELGVEI